MTMDLTDRKLLNLIQSQFPLVDQPYQQLGEELGITEEQVIDRLTELKRQNVVRQISAIFDTRRLGYKTTLVAMAYEPESLHDSALFINRHPGVSHNYAREGSYYNLWFTLAVPPDHDLETTAQRMAQDTQALSVRIMPTVRFFKIGVNFDMVRQKGSSYNYSPDGFDESAAKGWNKPVPISESDRAAIRELQEDLALVPRPFDGMAQRLGLTNSGL
ncbi:MAG: Lrp/AsnC family transcriptional regulator, partial [Dehalococcoidia bacterium]